MELATDKPRVNSSRQFNHFAKIGPRRPAGNDQTFFFELGQQRVIDFIAMAMALGHFGGALNFTGQRAFGQFADLCAQTHGAAKLGILAAFLNLTGGIEPLGNQANNREWRVLHEFSGMRSSRFWRLMRCRAN